MTKRATPGDQDLVSRASKFLEVVSIRFGPSFDRPCDIDAWRDIDSDLNDRTRDTFSKMKALREIDFACLPRLGKRDEVLRMMVQWFPEQTREQIIKIRLSNAGKAEVRILL